MGRRAWPAFFFQRCKRRELDPLTRSGDIRLSLPFSETLFRMSGASIEDWRRKEAEQDRSPTRSAATIR
jgi:hypothetical protein